MLSRRVLSALAGFTLLVTSGLVSAQAVAPSTGDARTLLPSGRTLITGGLGFDGQPSDTISLLDLDGTIRALPVRMAKARIGHTATVLPDGTVLIAGGIGTDKHLVSVLELFDPSTETIQSLPATLVPRAFHSATVLTNGTLLIVGGVTEAGIYTDAIQIWDYQSKTGITIAARLAYPRIQHQATLLANGDVLIAGGRSAVEKNRPGNEVFDHVRLVMRPGGTADVAKAIQVAETIPAEKATDVSVAQLIAVRFTKPAAVTTITDSTISLSDAAGNTVPIQVIAAEGGRLAFVLPATSLQPAMAYQLTASNVTDSAGNVIAAAVVHFQTADTPEDSASELWTPGPEALKGNWNSQTGGSKWQKLPPLQAAVGVTALSGQALRINGLPLSGVLLSVGSSSIRSDSTGRFLLKNLKPGHQVLTIDGRTANRAAIEYGLFEVGVDVAAAKTNVLKYTIWMTRLDTAHAIAIPSPTTAPDTVLTTPLLPGLEFHLPANTVIVDHEGRPARRLTITPIPLDKPPFPLPLGIAVPIYFTIQPGGSYIDVRGVANVTSKGGRLIYPNSFGRNPGTVFDFWNYDAESRGWYKYGQGKVTNDGRQIVPDPGVIVYQLTGAMVGGAGPAPGQFPPSGGGSGDGDPVDLSTGLFQYVKTDLLIADIIPLQLQRTYRTNDMQQRPFGIGTTHNYDFFIDGDTFPYTYQELIEPNGSRIRFDRISSGTSWGDAVYENMDAGSPYYGAIIVWDPTQVPNYPQLPGSWLLTLKNGTKFSFPESFATSNQDCQAVIQITDRHNNAIRFQRSPRSSSTPCQLQQVTAPSGRYISFQYDPSGRISWATDNSGREVHYQYDSDGNLQTVTDANGGTTWYTYDPNHNLLTIMDPRGITYLTIEYDANGRVTKQTLIDGSTYHFSWTPSTNSFQGWTFVCPECITTGTVGAFSRYSSNDSEGYLGLIAAVDITDPRGYVRHVDFNNYGYAISDTRAVAQPEQQTLGYTYYADGLLASIMDALGRVTSFNYDSLGNTTLLSRLANSTAPVITTFTYTSDFNELNTVTDPLNHTTVVGYNQTGDATTITDPLGNQLTASYYGTGQLKSVADSVGNTVSFTYLGADLATITDPLGSQGTLFDDSLGRVISSVDPAGNATKFQYDSLDEVLSITDPLGNSTIFGHDANGNVTSVTDANGRTNHYTYDIMDRIHMRTDPLLRTETYDYDLAGNLATLTDRKQQVSNYEYDAVSRLKCIGYGVVNGVPDSWIHFYYDAGNRLNQTIDSIYGTITTNYDPLDRLSGEITPVGSVSYTYDNADRRLTLQVAGQSLINYGWDNANRLTGITQGSSSIAFTYDSDNRRQTMTLPNRIVGTYSFDADSHLTGIDYTLDSTSVGNLAYRYDQLGRRISVAGSLAGSVVPQSIANSTYDAANELTNWNGTSISSDANGNITGDGTHSYTWDTRNQLASIDGGATASFVYDPFGRRATKSSSGHSVAFLYDGTNSVQELSGTTPTANMLTGGIDEYFTRADAIGTTDYLTDALGSTLALTDAAGTIRTQYAYEPFGATSVSGVLNASSNQYTGRENDGSGLYYYRARYYNPSIDRFVSEDPIGLAGGINQYAYAGNSPSILTDPSGLFPGAGVARNAEFAWNWFWETDGFPDASRITLNIRGQNKDFLYYGPDTPETQDMMNSPGMGWVQYKYWQAGCPGGLENVSFGTAAAYLTTTSDPSSTAFQVGAFSTDVQLMSDGTVRYTMYNKAGWYSLLGGLNFHIGDHDRQPAFPMHETHGFGGNVRQVFVGQGANPCGNRPAGRK